MNQKQDSAILDVRSLDVEFPRRWPLGDRLRGRPRPVLRAVDKISFTLQRGETMGLVGESGCGKSTLAKAILRLLEPSAGQIFLEGEDITHLSQKALRPKRRQMQMIFQDPYSSLNPRMSVEDILAEMLSFHKIVARDEVAGRVGALMEQCGLSRDMARRFPHEFSGGQRQRIGIARALALNPALVIADEPVSALDVSIQAQMINLLGELQNVLNLTMLFITHDISVVRYISRRVLVMYLGSCAELGPTEAVFAKPHHPYTSILAAAAPVPDPRRRSDEAMIEGDLPSPLNKPSGCCFHTRCPYAKARCSEETPALAEVSPERWCSCHFPLNVD